MRASGDTYNVLLESVYAHSLAQYYNDRKMGCFMKKNIFKTQMNKISRYLHMFS
jgi:hypothetical protein